MDYTRDTDTTIHPRRYKPIGAKQIVRCPKCVGQVVTYIENTVYLCIKHPSSVPKTQLIK